LDNKKSKVLDNAKYSLLKTPLFDTVIIVGGGDNAIKHLDGIRAFIGKSKSVAIIHSAARYVGYYADIAVPQYCGLSGNEGKRFSQNMQGRQFKGECILPPYPRTMGTDVPDFAKDKTYELEKISFTAQCLDSCTTLSLQVALEMQAKKIYFVGYDGYIGGNLTEKERDLTNENITVFQEFISHTGKILKSLTPTLYKELEIESVYQFL
jgi:4-hydroxy 2-oxovalerate aldolase